jgi:cytochrome c553
MLRPREQYYVTDFRVIVEAASGVEEIAAHDITLVDLTCSRSQRPFGTSTLTVASRRDSDPRLVFRDIRHGPQLALVVQLLASERHIDETLLRDAAGKGASDPFHPGRSVRMIALTLGAASALGAVVMGHGSPASPIAFPADDAIAPGGHKRTHDEIVLFMEREVMPFARRALGPIVGGADRVTCATCHGKDGAERKWEMPGVKALPDPELREAGLEKGGGKLDPQIRNAIYGYLADEDKQGTMGYMRSVVMPGMARLLNRPAYDFTRSYDYNRTHAAIGCYHCHRIK